MTSERDIALEEAAMIADLDDAHGTAYRIRARKAEPLRYTAGCPESCASREALAEHLRHCRPEATGVDPLLEPEEQAIGGHALAAAEHVRRMQPQNEVAMELVRATRRLVERLRMQRRERATGVDRKPRWMVNSLTTQAERDAAREYLDAAAGDMPQPWHEVATYLLAEYRATAIEEIARWLHLLPDRGEDFATLIASIYMGVQGGAWKDPADRTEGAKLLTGAELAAKHGFEPMPDWRKDPFVRPMNAFEKTSESSPTTAGQHSPAAGPSDAPAGTANAAAPSPGGVPKSPGATSTDNACVDQPCRRGCGATLYVPRTSHGWECLDRVACDRRLSSPPAIQVHARALGEPVADTPSVADRVTEILDYFAMGPGSSDMRARLERHLAEVRRETIEACVASIEALPPSWSPSTVARCVMTIRDLATHRTGDTGGEKS